LRTPQQGQPGGARDRNRSRRSREPSGGQNRDLIFGRNAVLESLRAGRRKHIRLLVADTVERDSRLDEIERLARGRSARIEAVPRDRIESLAAFGHQGVVLESSAYPYETGADLKQLAALRSIVLALDGLEDPRNVGTLLRTAEAVRTGLVVIPTDRAVGITPAVVNASSGAVEHLSVQRETNLVRWLDSARDAGFWIVGLGTGEGSQSLFDTDLAAPVVLVVGSEGRGLRRLVREKCDLLVSLPMTGKIESLNAAVAGSIGLYEIYRDSEEASQ
jgi:23S rRNA (guanosine2251-2'-O)-methyltransferase